MRWLRALAPALAATALAACTDALSPPMTRDENVLPALALLPGAERQITTDPGRQTTPAISGDRIVWADSRLGGENIFVFDLATGIESPITAVPTAAYADPDIDGDRVVWANRTTPFGTVMYDFSTGARTQISNDFAEWARISGDVVVWGVNGGGILDIRMKDLATGVQTTVAGGPNTQRNPDVSGNRIVWHENRGDNWDIYMLDLGTGLERRITTDPAVQHFPTIDGDRIAWGDRRNGAGDVYMFDLVTGLETRVTTDPGHETFPRLSGDMIVWQDTRNGSFDVYARDFGTGIETNLTPDASNQYFPSASGNRVVWYDDRTGNFDVFMLAMVSTEDLDGLQAAVADLEAQGALRAGQARALLTSLQRALGDLDAGNTRAAIATLGSFIRMVEAYARSGSITAAEAQPLIDGANEVIGALSG